MPSAICSAASNPSRLLAVDFQRLTSSPLEGLLKYDPRSSRPLLTLFEIALISFRRLENLDFHKLTRQRGTQ